MTPQLHSPDTTRDDVDKTSPLADTFGQQTSHPGTNQNSSGNEIRDGLIIQIVGGIAVLIIVFFWRRITHFVSHSIRAMRYQTFDSLQIRYTYEELKRTVKIIVIDDDDIFPVEGFKEFGYSIERWSKLTVQRLRELHDGGYDIVILDIYGVAKDLAEHDGLDILSELKTKNPAQVVVAYSGQSFDFSKNRFWELADEKLTKPTPFVGTQSIVDNLIERTFTIEYHKEKLNQVLASNNASTHLSEIEDLFVKAKLLGAEPDWIRALQFLQIGNIEVTKLKAILSKLYRLSIPK